MENQGLISREMCVFNLVFHLHSLFCFYYLSTWGGHQFVVTSKCPEEKYDIISKNAADAVNKYGKI